MNVVLLFGSHRALTNKGMKTDKGMSTGKKIIKVGIQEMTRDWRVF